MAKFIIQPHGRLNDWVAEEKGYFRDVGLDYVINTRDGRTDTPVPQGLDSEKPLRDVISGAFEAYTDGGGRKGEGAGDV